MTRDIIGVTDIGFRSEKPAGRDFFRTGVTRALSQLEGGVLFLTKKLCFAVYCVQNFASEPQVRDFPVIEPIDSISLCLSLI